METYLHSDSLTFTFLKANLLKQVRCENSMEMTLTDMHIDHNIFLVTSVSWNDYLQAPTPMQIDTFTALNRRHGWLQSFFKAPIHIRWGLFSSLPCRQEVITRELSSFRYNSSCSAVGWQKIMFSFFGGRNLFITSCVLLRTKSPVRRVSSAALFSPKSFSSYKNEAQN